MPLGHEPNNGDPFKFLVVDPTGKHNPLVRIAVQDMPLEIAGSQSIANKQTKTSETKIKMDDIYPSFSKNH